MRVGKFLEHMQAALKATAIQDPFVSYTAVGRQLGYMCYLVLDTLQWVSRSRERFRAGQRRRRERVLCSRLSQLCLLVKTLKRFC